MFLRTVVFDFQYSILSFPCLRAGALQRAGVETGIQACPCENRDPEEIDSCWSLPRARYGAGMTREIINKFIFC
jgi:hypothetical protein